jgi:plasmid replication initiation protein
MIKSRYILKGKNNMAIKILVNSQTPKVYKNKKLNNANFGDFNLNDYQVFLYLISRLGKVDLSGKYHQPNNLQREHVLTAKEFSSTFNLDLKNTYGIIKRSCKKLMKSSVTIEKEDLKEIWEINICSTAKYNQSNGSVTIKFTEEIMPYLAQVKEKFILYNIKEIANFGSLYTTRLYELIQEFKETGWIAKSVQQLREIFNVKEKFKKYNDFKKYTFGHAVDEINSQFDIDLTFREVKEGRKIVSIHFFFKKTIIRKTFNPHTGKDSNIYIKPKRK